MTRLEVRRASRRMPRSHDLGEIVGSALERASKILARHRVEVDLAGRPADARARCGAVRAGAVQSPRQRRQIRAGRHRRSASRAGASGDAGLPADPRRRARASPPATWSASSTSSIAPQKGDQVRAGTGPRARHLPRLRRGDGRHDRRRQPHRPAGRGVHHQAADPRPSRNGWTPPHERAAAQGPRRRRRAADPQAPAHGPEHAGLRDPRGAERQDGARAARARSPIWSSSISACPTSRAWSCCAMMRARNEQCPDRRPVEPQRRERQGRGARSRRRRLRDQAVRHGRAPRPHARRAPPPASGAGRAAVFRVGDLSVDLVRRIVKVGDEEVKLSPKEYDLLRVLVQHAGKVLTHKFLLGELWGALTDAQYLRVYVRQLRQKIEADPRAAALHPDRNRRRLPPARARLIGPEPCARDIPDIRFRASLRRSPRVPRWPRSSPRQAKSQ